MADETVKIEVSDEVETIVEDEAPVEEPEVEEPEVEEEQEEEKPKKEKKPKPARGKGRQEKGKGEEKGFSKGEAWWKETGQVLLRKGHSQRNVIMKAAREAGVPFDRTMRTLTGPGTVEEKAISLFD